MSICLGFPVPAVPASASTSELPQTSPQDFDSLVEIEKKEIEEEVDWLNNTRQALLRLSRLINSPTKDTKVLVSFISMSQEQDKGPMRAAFLTTQGYFRTLRPRKGYT